MARDTEDLSLFDIETGLSGMILARQTALESLSDLDENLVIAPSEEDLEEYRESLEKEIRLTESGIQEYAKAELVKVDSIARLWRFYEFCWEVAKKEAQRATRRAKSWENRLEYLKSVVAYAFGVVNKEKVETPINWLGVYKNSTPSVQIEPGKEGEIPDKFIRVNASLPLDIWKDMLTLLNPQERELVKFTTEFNLSLMSKELKLNPESIPGAKRVFGNHVRCG